MGYAPIPLSHPWLFPGPDHSIIRKLTKSVTKLTCLNKTKQFQENWQKNFGLNYEIDFVSILNQT